MSRITRREIAAHATLALTAASVGTVFSAVLGIPLYTLPMAVVVVAFLVPAEFVAVIIWDSLGKRRREATAGIRPPKAKVR